MLSVSKCFTVNWVQVAEVDCTVRTGFDEQLGNAPW